MDFSGLEVELTISQPRSYRVTWEAAIWILGDLRLVVLNDSLGAAIVVGTGSLIIQQVESKGCRFGELLSINHTYILQMALTDPFVTEEEAGQGLIPVGWVHLEEPAPQFVTFAPGAVMAGRRHYQPFWRLGNTADQDAHILVDITVATSPGTMTGKVPFLDGA